jgi:hypothetical protein
MIGTISHPRHHRLNRQLGNNNHNNNHTNNKQQQQQHQQTTTTTNNNNETNKGPKHSMWACLGEERRKVGSCSWSSAAAA